MEGTIKKVKIKDVLDLELEEDALELGQFDGNGNWNSVSCNVENIPKVISALEELYRFWLVETKQIESSILFSYSRIIGGHGFSPSRQDE